MIPPDRPPEGDAHAQWLGKLSHDLRNQLSPMRTATQMLLASRLEPARQVEMLELVDRQIGRMVRMLDDLSEYGAMLSGHHRVQSERQDLGILVDTALGECGRRIEAAGLAFEQVMPERRLPILGQRQRLVQMFMRLLDNAVRFTPRGGRVGLQVEVVGDVAVVTVRDTGAGFEPERSEAIFALPDAQRSAEGLGISLALARGCARAHGGDLVARSAGPGHGAEFVVTLPLAP